MEQWKDIPEWNRYQVSNLGRVRSKTVSGIDAKKRPTLKVGLVLTPYINKNNRYLYVTLSQDGMIKKFTIHRLVAACFCEMSHGGIQVNHIDGNKVNNMASNLEYVSASDNMKHAYRTGLNNITELKKKSFLTI